MSSTAKPQSNEPDAVRLAVPGEVTEWLLAWNDGDPAAFDELLALVYLELKRMAGRALCRERASHTLQTTALVHEAYLRLRAQDRIRWRNRAQFLGVAGGLMRRILVDHARRRHADKRAGGVRVTSGELAVHPPARFLDVLLLDEALSRLQLLDPRQARIVELRYFAGLKIVETAEVLGTSTRTIKREWTMARAWLKHAIKRGA